MTVQVVSDLVAPPMSTKVYTSQSHIHHTSLGSLLINDVKCSADDDECASYTTHDHTHEEVCTQLRQNQWCQCEFYHLSRLPIQISVLC